jgi:hypothetical protein
MITLGTESCGTNLLGGTVFFHRLAHAFTFLLAKLSHLFGHGRSESVPTPLAVGRSVTVAVSIAVAFHITTLVVFFVVVRIHIVVMLVLMLLVLTLIVVIILMFGLGQVGRCHRIHVGQRRFVDGITHAMLPMDLWDL